MVLQSNKVPIILSGDTAFYNQSDYVEQTKNEFGQKKALPAVTYTRNTERKITRTAKQLLSIIIFPIGIYKLIHAIIGKFCGVLPSSTPGLMGMPSDSDFLIRKSIEIKPAASDDWVYKRLTLEVDGYKIDAAIMGKPSTLDNKRWMLCSGGNGEFYEYGLYEKESTQKDLAENLESNVITFNYPGVGASSGLPNREAMGKAYRLMLSFLEEKLEAQEIIGYGHSIGGGVQGDALNKYKLNDRVKYVFIKSRTFSSLSTQVNHMLSRLLGLLIKIFGWNIDSVESSKKLKAPEIILQTANVKNYTTLNESDQIAGNDGVIRSEAALGKVLLDDKKCPRKNKLFVGIPEDHNEGLSDFNYLKLHVENFLQQNRH